MTNRNTSNPFADQRHRLGKTQRNIADELGFTPQNISSWENGKTVPDPADYDRVAVAYERDRMWVVESAMKVSSKRRLLSVAA